MNVTRVLGTIWLVHDGKRGIIVDAARKGHTNAIRSRIEPLGLTIPLLFLTHTHYDHSGCAAALQKHMRAKVIVGAAEADCLKNGYTPVPKGTHVISRIISNTGHKLTSKQTEHYEAVTQNIIPIDAERDLSEFGFDGKVVPLGGHTNGSIGLHMGDHFFSGDTVFGIGGGLYPPFADCPNDIHTAWERILTTGAKYICPGHGRMLMREQLEKQYQARYY